MPSDHRVERLGALPFFAPYDQFVEAQLAEQLFCNQVVCR
jgi:hypothetical protein